MYTQRGEHSNTEFIVTFLSHYEFSSRDTFIVTDRDSGVKDWMSPITITASNRQNYQQIAVICSTFISPEWQDKKQDLYETTHVIILQK